MKYSTQFINLANQNAQATRPKHIGSMNELIGEFLELKLNPQQWREFYLQKQGRDTLELASSKIKDKLQDMFEGFQSLMDNIDVVDTWVEDLVFNKTLKGFEIQSQVLNTLANGNPWRLATKYEESLGIDGFIDEVPYQIKPSTAKHNATVNQQNIRAKIVYYKLKGQKLTIE